MSEKIHNIDGKEFSESTIKNALEKTYGVTFEKPIPVPIISFATFENEKDRVVINLTPEMKAHIKECNAKQITIDKNGKVSDYQFTYKLCFVYSNQIPIFGEI